MTLMYLATLLTVLTVPTTQTDTTFVVRAGARLHVDNFLGTIAVQGWNRDAVRIVAAHAPRLKVWVEEAGSNFEVRAQSRRGLPGRVDYTISAPVWLPLSLTGVYGDMTVSGSRSEVEAETVKGDVKLVGGAGAIRLSSVEGQVIVSGAKGGRLELSSVNQGVTAEDVEGDLKVESVNGDVQLQRIHSRQVEVSSVNGDIRFLGEVFDGGRYHFESHNGDLDVGVPDKVNARVSVTTFSGEFESTFPLMLTGTRRGKRFDFTLGTGSAQIELETFQGTINLGRSSVMAQEKSKEKEKEKEK